MEMFNWTEIIVFLIGLVVSICVSLITKQLVPWLKDKKLMEAACVAVDAAEALYGRYHGDEKLACALDSLHEKGYDINSEEVIDAVRAAWKALDNAMHMTGEKVYGEQKEEPAEKE